MDVVIVVGDMGIFSGGDCVVVVERFCRDAAGHQLVTILQCHRVLMLTTCPRGHLPPYTRAGA